MRLLLFWSSVFMGRYQWITKGYWIDGTNVYFFPFLCTRYTFLFIISPCLHNGPVKQWFMFHSKQEKGTESVGLLLRVMLARGELQDFTPLSGSSPSLFLPHQIAMRILLRFNQLGDFYTGLWGKCIDIWKTQMGKGVPEGKSRTSRSVVAQAWCVGNMANPTGLMKNGVRSDDDMLWMWTFSALNHAFCLSRILVHAVLFFLLYTMKIVLAPWINQDT